MDKYKKFALCMRAIGISINNKNIVEMIYDIVADIENDRMKSDEDYARILATNEEALVADMSEKIIAKLTEMGVENSSESAQELAKFFMAKE